MSNISSLVIASRRHLKHLISVQMAPVGLNFDAFMAINELQKHSSMSLGELARSLRMDNPTMSRLVSKMIERGYVSSISDPSHGRKVKINLTPDGHSLFGEEFAKIIHSINEGSMSGMTAGESITLHDLLSKYLANLDGVAAKELPGKPLRVRIPKAGSEA